MLEITSEEQNKVKRMKRTEDSLRDLWDNIKCTNIQIIGVPDEEEKKKAYEKNFEEILVENFSNMGKEIVNQVQEAQRVPPVRVLGVRVVVGVFEEGMLVRRMCRDVIEKDADMT